MFSSKKSFLSPFFISFSALLIHISTAVFLASSKSKLDIGDFQLYVASLFVEVLIYSLTYIYLLKKGEAYGFKFSFENLTTGIYMWVLILLISGLYIYVLGLFGIYVEPSQYSVMKLGKSFHEKVFIVLSAILVAPLIEEVFFRGCLFPSMKKEFGYTYALFGSSLIFGLLHGFPYFFQTAVFGMLLAYMAEKNQSLDVSVFLHIFNNFLSIIITFIF